MQLTAGADVLSTSVQLLDIDDTILELLPAAVYVCDAGGLIVRYNRKASELWGRSPRLGENDERFCGAFRLFWPDGRALPHYETPMAEVLRTGKPARDLEIQIERPDGDRIWAVVNIDCIRNAGSQIVGAVNCFLDITARKRAESQLRESRSFLQQRERQFRELLEALPAAVYTTDPAGRITFYNEAAAELWGCRPEIGRDEWCGSWRLYWPDGTPMPHDQCPMAVALKEGRPIRGAEAVAERPDGSRVSFIPYPTPLHDASGTLVGAVNMLVDITERERAERRFELVAREVDHRAKNMLAVIQAMVRLTRAETLSDYSAALDGRIQALSRAHTLLSDSRWEGADLKRLVTEELAPYWSDRDPRIEIGGETVWLASGIAQSVAIAMHELATNSVKYGALTAPEGRVSVSWSRQRDARLVLRWAESGGPRAQPPSRRGFGMSVIERAVQDQLDGAVRFDWHRDGLTCEIDIPADALANEPTETIGRFPAHAASCGS